MRARKERHLESFLTSLEFISLDFTTASKAEGGVRATPSPLSCHVQVVPTCSLTTASGSRSTWKCSSKQPALPSPSHLLARPLDQPPLLLRLCSAPLWRSLLSLIRSGLRCSQPGHPECSAQPALTGLYVYHSAMLVCLCQTARTVG